MNTATATGGRPPLAARISFEKHEKTLVARHRRRPRPHDRARRIFTGAVVMVKRSVVRTTIMPRKRQVKITRPATAEQAT